MKRFFLLFISFWIGGISSAEQSKTDGSGQVVPSTDLDRKLQKEVKIEVSQVYSSSKMTFQQRSFNLENDLLLAQYDCKTDVDDLHAVAGFYTLLGKPEYSKLKFHAVAGSYGIQEGLYVPPNDLFQQAFGKKWSDAHGDFGKAVKEVKNIVQEIIKAGGDIWIAEGGQSDFSAAVIRKIQAEMPDVNTQKRFHIIQHGGWNEKVTTPEDLEFVKSNTDYLKIPDGNVISNGTPEFRSPNYSEWRDQIRDLKLKKVWDLAVELSLRYNDKDGRYNNEAVASGGLDFSDLVEICWILGLPDMKDSRDFFEQYAY